MQVSRMNDVRVYNLSSGKSLPEWLTDRKKRQLLKQDSELRRRIELIQDFDMPTASSSVRVTPDGQYLLSTGTYKPRIKCFDVNQLSVKYDRCCDSEVVKFEVLSEDFSKLVLLQADRYVEFHAQYGKYYRTRMPRFGRDLAYNRETCDLYLVGDGSEVFRLNLEQGQFLQPFTCDSTAADVNACEINPVHNMLACATSTGKVCCFDPRSRTTIGSLDTTTGVPRESLERSGMSAVTSLAFHDGLTLAAGTESGHVLLYDIRADKPYLVKDHLYEQPVKKIVFHDITKNIISADAKAIRLWDSTTGKSLTTIEPGVAINDFAVYPNSGLIFLANEAEKNGVYYIPSLGQAPRWCSFLDSITEELEESDEVVVYDDYKFVTREELATLGLSHLCGTNLVRAYMHGFFIDMRLYHKARSIVAPFAFDEYRAQKIRAEVEKERSSRIRSAKIPRVNRALAEKLIDGKKKALSDEGLSNPLEDDRFGAMFKNPDFQVDTESDVYKLLHPVVSKHEKRPNEQADNSEASTDDEPVEYEPRVKSSNHETKPSKAASKQTQATLNRDSSSKKRALESKPKHKQTTEQSASDSTLPSNIVMYEVDDEEAARVDFRGTTAPTETFADRLKAEDTETTGISEQSSVLGCKEARFETRARQPSEQKKQNNRNMKAHLKERKEARRSLTGISDEKKKAVFWRGKKVK